MGHHSKVIKLRELERVGSNCNPAVVLAQIHGALPQRMTVQRHGDTLTLQQKD